MMAALPSDLVNQAAGFYQRFVIRCGDEGAKRQDAVDAVAQSLREEGVPLPDMFQLVADQVITKLDDKDRLQQPDTLQTAADALAGDTILGDQDPVLDRICAVGSGIRKPYRLLNQDDLLTISARKADHAAAAAAASARVANVVRTLISAMRRQRVAHLGELFG